MKASSNNNKNHKSQVQFNIGLEKGDVCGRLTGAQVPQAFLADDFTIQRPRPAQNNNTGH